MVAIAPGQSSSCTNPVLDIFTQVSGSLVNVDSLEYIIFENVSTPGSPVQVFPPSGRATVDITQDCPTGQRIGTGHYVALWDVPVAELIGSHFIQWFMRLTPTSPEVEFQEEFEVLPTGALVPGEEYCTLADVRAEGAPASITDARINRMIGVASRYIDRYTGRFFSPKALTFKLDGRGHPALFLHHPIIDITSVTIELTPGTLNPLAVDLTDLAIYNRHIREGLTDPDDRNNPKIEFFRTNEDIVRAAPGSTFLLFPRGRQNVTVDGTFGYTDFDGTALGKTPDLICEACLRATLRLLGAKINDVTSGAGTIWKEVTRDQRVEYANPDRVAIQGAFFGDPEIDQILASYRRPLHIGVA